MFSNHPQHIENNKTQYLPRQRHSNLSPYSKLNSNNKKYSYHQQFTQHPYSSLAPTSKYNTKSRDTSLIGQRRSITPQNRRFKYSDDIKDQRDKSIQYRKDNTQNKNSQDLNKYNTKIGIKRLDEMPMAAKQIYARIQPRSKYRDNNINQGVSLANDQNNRTRPYSRNILDKYNLKPKEKQEYNPKQRQLQDRPLKKYNDYSYDISPVIQNDNYKFNQTIKHQHPINNQNNSYILNNQKLKQQQIVNKYHNDQLKTNKTRNQKYQVNKSYKYQTYQSINNKNSHLNQYDRQPLINNERDRDNRIKKLQLPSGRMFQRLDKTQKYIQEKGVSPINQLLQQIQQPSLYNRKSIEFKPYYNIIKQPNVFQNTYNSKTNKIKTTDHSNGQQLEQNSFTKDYSRFDNKREHQRNYQKERQYHPRQLQQNRPSNYQLNYKNTQSFSRKLNQYEDEALNKIKTINQLNNKIGQRIKNILSSIN